MSSPEFTQQVNAWSPNLCSHNSFLSLHFLSEDLWLALHTSFKPDSTSQQICDENQKLVLRGWGLSPPAPGLVWLAPSVCAGHYHVPASHRLDFGGGGWRGRNVDPDRTPMICRTDPRPFPKHRLHFPAQCIRQGPRAPASQPDTRAGCALHRGRLVEDRPHLQKRETDWRKASRGPLKRPGQQH